MSTILDGRSGRIVLLLLGVLLAATVLPAGSEPEAGAVPDALAGEAVEPRAWYTIAVPAASFIPTSNNHDYTNSGDYVSSDSGFSYFLATVPFPFPSVTVKQVHLHAYDHDTGNVCVKLYRSKPVQGTEVEMAEVCSSGSSITDPSTFKDTSIAAAAVGGYTSAYLWLQVPDGQVWAYGVTIKYTA
jgi:hypothetical protein